VDVKTWANTIAAQVIGGLVHMCSVKFVLNHAMERFPKAIEVELNNLLDEVEKTAVCDNCNQKLAS
jgi:hypothetical protein